MSPVLTAPDLASTQAQLRMVAACRLLALSDADRAVRSQVRAGALVDPAALAAQVATARETLQLAEAALLALS